MCFIYIFSVEMVNTTWKIDTHQMIKTALNYLMHNQKEIHTLPCSAAGVNWSMLEHLTTVCQTTVCTL